MVYSTDGVYYVSYVYVYRCMVRLTGGMMISFPAGIVRVLADHPSPPQLAFRVKNTTRTESIVINNQLVTE